MPKIVDHHQQRLDLSATATRLIAEVGLENTTLRRVAIAHNCTKGMVQHYFINKEELLLGALRYVEDRYTDRMSQISKKYSGLELLEKQLLAILPLREELRDEWSVRIAFNTRAHISEPMRHYLSTCYQRQLRSGVKLLREANRKQKLRIGLNYTSTYRSLIALITGLGVGAVMNPEQLPGSAQKRILADAIAAIQA